MPMIGIKQPDIIQIDDTLRLRKFDAIPAEALDWYQDRELVFLVDGVRKPYTQEKLENMYSYLNKHGELYLIEVQEKNMWKPIGDVSFWQEDMPIVIGAPAYRGRGLGRKIIKALIDRGRELGWDVLYVDEIYHDNVASRKCFEYCGFSVCETTETGSRFQLRLNGGENMQYNIVKLVEHPEMMEFASRWFHEKWGIPQEAYRESMEESLKMAGPVPQWYVVMNGEKIVGGLGVIENDFHDRYDLTPNVCAVYVEESHRKQGIAGKMLNFVCDEFRAKGIPTLYLLTDHDSFYERYGWEFYCMAQGDGEEEMARMYIHRME